MAWTDLNSSDTPTLFFRDSPNATLSVADKDNLNSRASFRGNRHDLRMLVRSVGGCAHTCVGRSSGKVKEKEGETTISERGRIPCARVEIFFF